MMRKERYVQNFAVALVLTSCLLVLPGCGKSGNESDSKSAKIEELSRQIAPLQVRRAGKTIETITLNQAMNWHESHEHEDAIASVEENTQPQGHHHICLGVVTGYQAIRYAKDNLFPDEIPEAADFDIKVAGSMDGIWDVMSFYTGRELKFDGEPNKLDLESYTFTAKRISQDKSLIFRIRQGLIPEEFFVLKNQGATCSSSALRKVKQQALLNILSAEPKDCFQIIDANCIANL